MIRIILIASALALAACAPATNKGEAPVAPNGAVPAPTPDDVTLRINAAQNGQRIEVGINQRFAVELVGVPTAGYVWAPAQAPAFLTRAGEASGNTSEAQSQPGFAGGSHWEVLMFAATNAGEGELVLEQRRPWETSEPPNDTFRVTIVAR
jgi:inhibitor of cysteine peptidase